ncbi:MAG: hypothetical protein JXR88_07890, partial [Clostridia bacterium]|nr:hypothetical protein [Clostridia bacterium]
MFENKDANRSLLIPKWHSIIDIGRFDYASVENTQYRIDQKTRDLMLNDYHDFLLSPTLTKAADLLNSAIILNDKEIASEVSNFINLNPLSSSSMKSLSNRVLNGTSSSTVDNSLSSSDKIRAVKHQLVDQERNALLWIELARLYSMKGLYRKATNASLVAINLAPTNRFIVRSSVRFFIHTGDLDEAYTISKKAFEQTNDPWIRSTFINCSILVDMKLKNIPMLNIDEINNNKLFHFSELLSSSAMLDIRL